MSRANGEDAPKGLASHLRRLCELELELIQSQMAQKPMLRGEVGVRALRVRSVSREEVWASAGVHFGPRKPNSN